MNPALQSSFTH